MTLTAEAVRADNDMTGRVLSTLQERIGPQRFNAWFRRCAQLSVEEGRVKVAVPNPFVANWIETHYQADIAEAVKGATGKSPAVVVAVDPALCGDLRQRQFDAQADQVAKAGDGRARPRQAPAPCTLRHNLKEFVVGESNKLAYSAALAVASGQASFNPLFVYGSCGVGKTHLLQGICMHASKLPGKTGAWRYVTGEQFTNEFISSLRAKRLEEFRNRYRKLDLLAIDDVHFLSAKKATQDEFLHTFNAIQSLGNPIVMASDAHPRMVGELNEQLTSRFLAGMVVKIDPPDQATRMEILRRRSAALRLHVPNDVMEYVALHVRGSVRELEGTLIKLAALAELDGGRITMQLACDALADHLARTDSAVTLGDIEAVVAAFFGITPADIHSSRRTRTVSLARGICMFLARRHTRMSFPEIGKFMGKNHSSAIMAVQRLESLIASGGSLGWMTPAGPKSLPAAKALEMLSEQIH
ncbi:MAG: chromosomal replication initiator protein DnaA [Phycisphaerae bacterium]